MQEPTHDNKEVPKGIRLLPIYVEGEYRSTVMVCSCGNNKNFMKGYRGRLIKVEIKNKLRDRLVHDIYWICERCKLDILASEVQKQFQSLTKPK